MRQYYKHHGKTVLNLINKSLINCAGISSSNSQWYWVFIAQNRIHFKTRKTRVFPGFFSQLSETRVLKFCSELETLLLPCLDPFTNSEVTNNTNKTVAKVMHLRDIVAKEIKKTVIRLSDGRKQPKINKSVISSELNSQCASKSFWFIQNQRTANHSQERSTNAFIRTLSQIALKAIGRLSSSWKVNESWLLGSSRMANLSNFIGSEQLQDFYLFIILKTPTLQGSAVMAVALCCQKMICCIICYNQNYHRSRNKNKDGWGNFILLPKKENNCFCLYDKRQIICLPNYLREPFASPMSYSQLRSCNRHGKRFFSLAYFFSQSNGKPSL